MRWLVPRLGCGSRCGWRYELSAVACGFGEPVGPGPGRGFGFRLRVLLVGCVARWGDGGVVILRWGAGGSSVGGLVLFLPSPEVRCALFLWAARDVAAPPADCSRRLPLAVLRRRSGGLATLGVLGAVSRGAPGGGLRNCVELTGGAQGAGVWASCCPGSSSTFRAEWCRSESPWAITGVYGLGHGRDR